MFNLLYSDSYMQSTSMYLRGRVKINTAFVPPTRGSTSGPLSTVSTVTYKSAWDNRLVQQWILLVGWLVGWLLCLTLKKIGRMEEGDVCVCVCFCDICKVPILRFFILKHVTTKDTEVWWSMLVDERLNSDTSTYELLVARIKESFRLGFVHHFWCDRISTSV